MGPSLSIVPSPRAQMEPFYRTVHTCSTSPYGIRRTKLSTRFLGHCKQRSRTFEFLPSEPAEKFRRRSPHQTLSPACPYARGGRLDLSWPSLGGVGNAGRDVKLRAAVSLRRSCSLIQRVCSISLFSAAIVAQKGIWWTMRHPSQIFLSAIPRMTFEKGFVSISAGLNPQITQQSNSSIHDNDLT